MNSFLSPTIDLQKAIVGAAEINRLNEYVSDFSAQETEEPKTIFTLAELFALDVTEIPSLLDPLLSSTGQAAITGKPDCGKSTWCRQLALSIVTGESQFLDMPLHAKYGKVIYVSTEDDAHRMRNCFEKQYSAMKNYAADKLKNLIAIIADTKSTEEIIEELNRILLVQPADLVVIDSFGDVFIGSDSNGNIAMRNTLKMFSPIANRSLVLHVHHINKSAYNSMPDQAHVQGGSGFVQKLRCVLDLHEGTANERFLSVTKGNYLPKKEKDNVRILNFNEDTLLFSDTGERCPRDQIISPLVSNGNQQQAIDWQVVFGDNIELPRKELIRILRDKFNMSERTAIRRIAELKSSLKHGFYQKPDDAMMPNP